jgi:hypothetical protein
MSFRRDVGEKIGSEGRCKWYMRVVETSKGERVNFERNEQNSK